MNYFVVIEKIEDYDDICYYAVKLIVEGEEEPNNNEFEKFILKFREHENQVVKEEYEDIIAIIDQIGNNSNLLRFLRVENAAFALPPEKGFRIETIEIPANTQLRLYCIVVSKNIVIICNGGWKTENRAQDCPNVSGYFRFAEKLAKYLSKNKDDFQMDEKEMECGEKNGFYL